MCKKSCFDCVFSVIEKGENWSRLSPATPDKLIDCRKKDIEKYLREENYKSPEKIAKDWNRFYTEPASVCEICGKYINKAKYKYNQDLIVPNAYQTALTVVCSQECKEELKKQR